MPQILTALHAGGRREADIATPTRDPALALNTDIATPAPEGKAISTPTHKLLNIPLFKKKITQHHAFWIIVNVHHR